MRIPSTVASKLAHLLGLPRKYAIGRQGRWSRRHQDINAEEFERLLEHNAVCVAFRNTNGENTRDGYTDDHRFILFDIDAGAHFDKARRTTFELSEEIENIPGVDHLVLPSGKKGFHIYIFLTDEIDYRYIASWQHQVLTGLGYTRKTAHQYCKIIRTIEHKNEDDEIIWDDVNVETLITFGDNDGYVVKVPFSRHPARTGFYEFPIRKEDILEYDNNTPPTQEQWDRAIEIFNRVQPTDSFLILLATDGRIDIPEPEQRGRRRSDPVPRLPMFNIPEHSEHAARIRDFVRETPCLKKCMDMAVNEVGIYWHRAVLVSVLACRGFQRKDIAVFFRDYINDEEDNVQTRNSGILQYQINYWAPRKGVSNCRVLSKPESRFFCCPGPCGRKSPAHNEPPLHINIPAVDGRPTPEIFDDIYQNEDLSHTQIYGTMRSRKTTEAILGAVRNHKKAVVIVPRISIMKQTGTDILNRAGTNGLECYSCYIPDNRELCLRLKQKINLLRRQHNIQEGSLSAFELLKRVEKPKCKNCKYNTSAVPDSQIQPNILYGDSDLDTNICGYQTIIQNRPIWNVLWISDTKFVSVASAQGMKYVTPIMNCMADTDAYILDEISHFVETPSLEVDIYKLDVENPDNRYEFSQVLKQEVRELTNVLRETIPDLFDHEEESSQNQEIRRINEIEAQERRFSEEVRIQRNRLITNPDEGSFLYRRRITNDEMTELKRIEKNTLRSIMVKAEYDNTTANAIIDMLDLGTQMEWIFTNVPNESYSLNIAIKIAPKVSEYVGYLQESGAKIIALDATPPAVPLDSVFNHHVQKINIGDPAGTNEQFVIIPDSVKIFASKLYRIDNTDRLANWIRWTVRLFGEEAIGLLMTSKKGFRHVKERILDDFCHIDTLYHRGERVLGVAYDKRVGVSVCPPLAPKNVAHWLKILHANAFRDISSNQLWRYEQARQTQQAEARFKDPLAIERSGVLAFGQTSKTVKESYANAIVQPRILKTLKGQTTRRNEPPIQVIQLAIWKKYGGIVEKTPELKAIVQIARGENDREAQKNSGCPMETVKILREILEVAVPEVFSPMSEDFWVLSDRIPDTP